MKNGMVIALAVSLSGIAAADEVKLASGRVLEGIAREEPGRVIVETGMGTVTVPADQVTSIVPGRTALHEYRERVASLGTEAQAAQVFETALWAREQCLTRYVNPLLQWTIALDPDHAQARRLLDYVYYEGRWMPTHERNDLQATRVQMTYAKPEGKLAHRSGTYPDRRTRPRPEISPGYVYFGIPPSLPPRGSQVHGYGDSYSFSYPMTASSSYGTMTQTAPAR